MHKRRSDPEEELELTQRFEAIMAQMSRVMAPNQIRSLFDTLMSSDNGPKPLPLPMTPTEAISRSPSPPMPSRDHRLDDPVPALLPSGARFAKFGFALNKQWYQLREEDNTLTKQSRMLLVAQLPVVLDPADCFAPVAVSSLRCNGSPLHLLDTIHGPLTLSFSNDPHSGGKTAFPHVDVVLCPHLPACEDSRLVLRSGRYVGLLVEFQNVHSEVSSKTASKDYRVSLALNGATFCADVFSIPSKKPQKLKLTHQNVESESFPFGLRALRAHCVQWTAAGRSAQPVPQAAQETVVECEEPVGAEGDEGCYGLVAMDVDSGFADSCAHADDVGVPGPEFDEPPPPEMGIPSFLLDNPRHIVIAENVYDRPYHDVVGGTAETPAGWLSWLSDRFTSSE